VSVYYPANLRKARNYDVFEWKTKETEKVKTDIKYFPYGKEEILSMSKVQLSYKLINFMQHLNVNAQNKSILHEDFENATLVPVIFSHGLSSNRRTSFSTFSELVSNGCIVFAITHTDGSASMYDKDKKNFEYET